MLTQEEIKKYAHMRRLKLSDQIWKDYLQDVLLHLLYRKMPKMVFSGGTCIWKIFKGDRFSEDIDAYYPNIPDELPEYLTRELSLLGIACKILKRKTTSNMLFLKLGLSFPSHPREITVSIEILSDKPRQTINAALYSPYPDVPQVEMVVLAPEMLLVNKISAIYGRNKSRDVHDLYLLLKSGIAIDAKLIKKTIPNFNLESFEKNILKKRPEWKGLEPLIVTKLPTFKEELKYILHSFSQYFKK